MTLIETDAIRPFASVAVTVIVFVPHTRAMVAALQEVVPEAAPLAPVAELSQVTETVLLDAVPVKVCCPFTVCPGDGDEIVTVGPPTVAFGWTISRPVA